MEREGVKKHLHLVPHSLTTVVVPMAGSAPILMQCSVHKSTSSLRSPLLLLQYGQIKSNLFAQNTSHFNAASGEAVDVQGQQGSTEHLQ